ncbi:hypothetical protein K458DRAFT_416300 [Lentithecium fluviatile CBS 122367]|uniref:Uncharacterized protein n=1 Tax=Lentithecium fluviatile CBS 122367 TaxID=1168545 RepID=A0A6G1J9S2_9PLEO|nr:hypothetical protein K458DRAFT_416300 [Lentithecium fluviatile CBS 122367]
MTSHGQKVTSDPASKHASAHEAVGVVTSDSLAAESLKGDGSFGEGNPKAAASKQPSKSTNTNNTDVSSATKLNPAVDAEAREAQEGWNETAQLNAGAGLGKDAGKGPTYATNTSTSGPLGGVPNSEGGNVTGGYAGAADQARDPGEFKPKGKGLTETDDLDGKTALGEVGTDQDPSRKAETDILKRDAMPGAAAAAKDTSAQDGGSKFSGLSDEQA